ncbi:MAG: hypothetical protein NkDv07_0784 [Candidatus Improbicoccus devescovinae]|nr:MAG: hypothetical protein NkDv07_0784 [Candidatus Improbicoccus devescovinae]
MPEETSTLTAQSGVYIAQIVEKGDDKHKNQLKIIIPSIGTGFIGHASIISVNGQVSYPDPGDNVAVLFLGGNLANGLIVGKVYDSVEETKNPVELKEDNDVEKIITKTGFITDIISKKDEASIVMTRGKDTAVPVFLWKEKDKIMEFGDPKGDLYLNINLEKSEITIVAKSLVIKEKKDGDANTVTIGAETGVSIEMAKDVMIKSDAKVTVESSSDVSIKASNLNLEAQSKAAIKGTSGVDLN